MNFYFFFWKLWKNFWNQKYLWKLKKVEVAPLRSRPRNIQCYSLGYGHGVSWSCQENCNWTFIFFLKTLKKFLKSKVFVKVEKSCGRSAPVTARLLILGYGFTTHAGGVPGVRRTSRNSGSLRSSHGPELVSFSRTPCHKKLRRVSFKPKPYQNDGIPLSKMPYFKLVSNSRPNLTPI